MGECLQTNVLGHPYKNTSNSVAFHASNEGWQDDQGLDEISGRVARFLSFFKWSTGGNPRITYDRKLQHNVTVWSENAYFRVRRDRAGHFQAEEGRNLAQSEIIVSLKEDLYTLCNKCL